MDDYLEKLFADAYRRELDQEETVVRSLPFIAAAAAIVIAVVRELGSHASRWDGSPSSYLVHSLLILIGGALVYNGWFVFRALRRRPYRYPRGESEIRETAERLVDYHQKRGHSAAGAEAAAHADIKREMLAQFAVCAEANRKQNESRQRDRTQAFHGLMAAFLFATAFVATTYLNEALIGGHWNAPSNDEADSKPASVVEDRVGQGAKRAIGD